VISRSSKGEQMDVTVAICTYERYGGVEEALQSLAAQKYDPSVVNTVVIDNGPQRYLTYHPEIVEKFNRLFPVTVVTEPRLGISNARNKALSTCRTSHIAFLDDDCIASPNWLKALIAPIQLMGDAVGAVGGRSLGIWNFEMPTWLSRSLQGYLSIIDWGPKRMDLIPPLYLVGGNSLFLVRALREAGGFDTALGRLGGTLLGNEEIEVCDRIRDAGYRILYEPEAIVGHKIPQDRAQMEWFRKRVFWQAVSDLIQGEQKTAGNWPVEGQAWDADVVCSSAPQPIRIPFDCELKNIYRLVSVLACGYSVSGFGESRLAGLTSKEETPVSPEQNDVDLPDHNVEFP